MKKNLKKNDDKCFQYAVTNHETTKILTIIQKKISNFISFLDKYNCKEISFPWHVKD